MPGRRLSDRENSLLRFWIEPPKNFGQPLLKGISIEGPPALRGIERVRVPFEYPITAISGKNGVGKSTILALAAFSSYRPTDWVVSPWPTRPKQRQPKRTSYAWKDFFFRRPEDPSYDGLTVRFAFSHEGNDIEISRRYFMGRWRTVPDPGRSIRATFPRRPIEFLSLSRILPSAELEHVRRQFSRTTKATRYEMTNEMLGAMSAIFRQQYSSIMVEERGGARLARCTAGASYNGFDMGAGEHAVVSILLALQRLPAGGMLIVEEIEHALHPEAQRYLIEVLTDLIYKRKQQIILTTHSRDIIDGLPRQGRALVSRIGNDHRVSSSPTTRFAMANMTGLSNPEATMYVEDNFVAALIGASLPHDIRIRIEIIPIGDAHQVATQLAAHKRGDYPGPATCIFDGDCSGGDIAGWFHSEGMNAGETDYVILPGGKPPELWVLNELLEEPYLSRFAERLELEPGVARAEILRLLALQDHHDAPLELAHRCRKAEGVVVGDMVFSLASQHVGLDAVREAAEVMLDPERGTKGEVRPSA